MSHLIASTSLDQATSGSDSDSAANAGGKIVREEMMLFYSHGDSDIDRDADETPTQNIPPALPQSIERHISGFDSFAAATRELFYPLFVCFSGLGALAIYLCFWFASTTPTIRSGPGLNNVVDAIFNEQFTSIIYPLSSIATCICVGCLCFRFAYVALVPDPETVTRYFDLSHVCITRWLLAIASSVHLAPKLVFYALMKSSSFKNDDLEFQFVASMSICQGVTVFLIQCTLYLLDHRRLIISHCWLSICTLCIMCNSLSYVVMLNHQWSYQSTADGISLTLVGQLASYGPFPLLASHVWLIYGFLRHRCKQKCVDIIGDNVKRPAAVDDGYLSLRGLPVYLPDTLHQLEDRDTYSGYSNHTELYIGAIVAALVTPTLLSVVASSLFTVMFLKCSCQSPYRDAFQARFLISTMLYIGLLMMAVWVPINAAIVHFEISRNSNKSRNAATSINCERCSDIARCSDQDSSLGSGSLLVDMNDHDDEEDNLPPVFTDQQTTDLPLQASEPMAKLHTKVNAYMDSLTVSLETLVKHDARVALMKAKIADTANSSRWSMRHRCGHGDDQQSRLDEGQVDGAAAPKDADVDGNDDRASMVTLCDHQVCVLKRHFFGGSVDCYFDLNGILRCVTANPPPPPHQQPPTRTSLGSADNYLTPAVTPAPFGNSKSKIEL